MRFADRVFNPRQSTLEEDIPIGGRYRVLHGSDDPRARLAVWRWRFLGHAALVWLTCAMGLAIESLRGAFAEGGFPDPPRFTNQPVPHRWPNARAVAVSPDGKFVAGASVGDGREAVWDDAGRVAIWEMSTGRLVRVIETRGDLLQLRFSADGKSVVYGITRTLGDAVDDDATFVRAIDDAAEGVRFPGTGVFASSPSGDDILLADPVALCLHDRLSRSVPPAKVAMPLGGSAAEGLAYAPGGESFAAVYRTREPVAVFPDGVTRTLLRLRGLARYDAVSMQPTAVTASDALANCSSLDVAGKGAWVATGHDDGAVRLWKGSTLEPIGTIEGQAGGPTLATFNPDGTELAVLTQPLAAGDGIQPCQLTFHRVPGLEPLRRIEFVDGAFTTSHARRDRAALNPRRLAYLPGGDAVVVGVGGVSLVDSATGAMTRAFDADHGPTGAAPP